VSHAVKRFRTESSRNIFCSRPTFARALAVFTAALALCVGEQSASAAGFEVPENTTKSVARGGTGVVNKRDPSALYFNPALLPRADGFQFLINLNLVNLSLDFQRDPLVRFPGERREETVTFDPVHNEAGFFPAPFVTMSWDFGVDDFAMGAGIFGPSGYGERCFGVKTDGGCVVDPDGAARYMMVSSELLEFFASLGAGYTFHLPVGELSVGATGMLAYLDTNFTLAVHGTPSKEKLEEPENDAIFRGESIGDWAMTGTFGLAYDIEGFRVAASYRLPISWEAHGSAHVTPAEAIGVGGLTEEGLTLNTTQAGVLRTGVAYEGGVHPADADLPRYDVEFNVVWEDWSELKYFEIRPDGDLLLGSAPVDLGTLYQVKNYQDTFSYRLGGSYAINEWLSGHAGGFYETAAQPEAYTNVDFVSWDRFAAGLGVTFRLYDHFDLDLAYQHVFSPDRVVTDGKVHQQVPMSGCKGPDYQNQYCIPEGTPPGNPQNNGTWSSSFQTASIGLTFYYE
jgi:long-chain fatty acid transport protein